MVPFFTQLMTESNYESDGFSSFNEADFWRKRICGIVCAKMVIAHFTHQIIPLRTLLNLGLEKKAYMSGVGWIHKGLADIAAHYYLIATCRSVGQDLTEIEDSINSGALVIASVSDGFNPFKQGGHLTLIIGNKTNSFMVHNPSRESGYQWPNYEISKENFLKSFSVRGNVVIISSL